MKTKLRVFTAFSGYDSQCMALDRIGLDYELVGWSEFDPESRQPTEKQPAVMAHNAVYPQWADRNYGDISKIDWEKVPDFDFFTYSFPCQDISMAGMQRGLGEGSGTRSSLLWECRKAIVAKKPKYMMMENVKALTGKKFIGLFNKWQAELESYGYRNFAKVLNAKDYGVPQNRERVFLISILEEGGFVFPEKMPLERRLKDVLEKDVDERFYLSNKLVEGMISHCERKRDEGCGFRFEPTHGEGVAKCINTQNGCHQTDTFIQGPLNPMPDGSCRTIKNQYQKNGMPNFISKGSFGATGVMEYENTEDSAGH